jgi:hypothetical protein
MEVHHSHHTAHKKKWNEYILEFVMLFAAVTLGFFAENYREHTIVEHRMQENYEAIIIDLKQDNEKLDSIFNEAQRVPNIIALSHHLFQFKTNIITEKQLVDSIYSLEAIPSYTSLYINNSTFKNMQSSGLLSYVNNKEIKSKLSYYYEVLFKRINDNNKLFDDVGINYFDNYLVFNQGTWQRILASFLFDKYEKEFKDPLLYKNFAMNLKSNRKIITSDEFANMTTVYLSRYLGYYSILKEVKQKNESLIQLIEAQLKH